MKIETGDIVLAATLKCLGHRMKGLTKIGNKGIFLFEDIPDGIVIDYDLGNLLVEPIAFNGAIRSLTTASRRA